MYLYNKNTTHWRFIVFSNGQINNLFSTFYMSSISRLKYEINSNYDWLRWTVSALFYVTRHISVSNYKIKCYHRYIKKDRLKNFLYSRYYGRHRRILCTYIVCCRFIIFFFIEIVHSLGR